ncbi:Diguanylate cyclase [Bosea sp. LC85]|nr:Diguanylate cyclase [Bosea sp. LC85]
MADERPGLAALVAWGGSLAACIAAILVASGLVAGAGAALPAWLIPSLGIAAAVTFAGAAQTIMKLLRQVEAASLALSANIVAPGSGTEAASDLLSEARGAQEQITQYRREIERLQDVDPVTGLGNRKWLQIRTVQELSRAARERIPLCFILISIDKYDEIAERLGFSASEALQLHVADILKSFVRPYDVVARVSASEFGVLMPGASAPTTSRISERLKDAVTANPPILLGGERPEIRVTAVERRDDETIFDEILTRARGSQFAGKHDADRL